MAASIAIAKTPTQKVSGHSQNPASALSSAAEQSPTQASALLYSQSWDGQSIYGPSELWQPAGTNSEVADDFDVTGNIDRVYAAGYVENPSSFQGVYVRFYEYLPNGTPGALQREYFLTTGYNAGDIDVPLSPPFAATGKHFLSVQVQMHNWYWWSADTNAPQGQAFYLRNVAAGQPWHHDTSAFYPNADVAFSLYGTVTAPGQINSLAESTLTRSGYLEILGTNFGSSGQVLVDGISAFVADWQSTRVIAYVPEAARLTTVPVQVVNGTGQPSNIVNLTVTARQANGRANWRFRMNGPYSQVRPVIASDGTVYTVDVFGHLYALTPDGALKWLAFAGEKGVALGADGTIYVASESTIKAFNPNGTEKWTFVQNPRAFICLGVSVGPEGNIYSVGSSGMGVFSLTPEGILRWTNPEAYARPIVDYGEIVFGPNGNSQQLYFYANNHLRAVALDGASVFTVQPGALSQLRAGQQPVVAPDGSVHTVLNSYAPNGDLLWSFATQYPYNVFTAASIGSDGVHYFVQNLSQQFSLNSNGSQHWHRTAADYLGGPIVDPLNTQLLMGNADTLDHAGFIMSASATDGHELWRVVLPLEDPTVWNPGIGMFGFNQFVDTRAHFATDGLAAYVVTATATGDNNTSRSFVYSLNTGTGGSPTPTPTSTAPPMATPTPTATPAPTATPVATPTPIPTPMTVTISGTISSGTAPSPGPMSHISLALADGASGSTSTDGSGNYLFSSLTPGANYIVTPSKAARTPGSQGINTVDVLLAQRHFLGISLLSGYRLTAADVNNDGFINTVDVIAIQRFFLGFTTGIVNVGKYSFSPANRVYSNLMTSQTGQNYNALIFGDVNGDTSPPVGGDSLGTSAPSAAAQSSTVSDPSGLDKSLAGLPPAVAVLSLPRITVGTSAVGTSVSNFIAAVTTSAIDGKNNLVGFQGDFIFDERAVTFQSQPVQKAGLTGGNWNVSGNVLPGTGPIRTLRISAFSNDFTPLSGSGTLFELRVSSTSGESTQLVWAPPPDNFIFIDSDLKVQAPASAAPGSVARHRSTGQK